jgi:hypothetical protein
MTSDGSATSPWNAITERDFRRWWGLPESAAYADFDEHFPRLQDAEALGLLGARNMPRRYRIHVAQGYPHNLQAWFDGPTLVLVETKLPQLPYETGDLLEALGEPTALLDAHWGALRVVDGLRVHADRGIAVLVGPEFQVLELSLFAHSSLEGYLAHLHRESQLIERPLRESDHEKP